MPRDQLGATIVLNYAGITADSFQGFCYNCGYGDHIMEVCPFCLTTNDIEQTKSIVASKYPKAAEHIASIAAAHPEQAVEWVAKSLHGGSGRYPEDAPRFNEAWSFHQQNKGQPKFRETAKALYPEANPKNPLDFTLHQMEHVKREMQTPAEKEVSRRALARGDFVHPGASVYYDTPTHRIIKIGGEGVKLEHAVDAACKYGDSTEWCTRHPDTAKEYLQKSPLYVFYKKEGDKAHKIAQGHFGDDFQLMDPQDNEIDTRDEV